VQERERREKEIEARQNRLSRTSLGMSYALKEEGDGLEIRHQEISDTV
jgi:hypothetical protein